MPGATVALALAEGMDEIAAVLVPEGHVVAASAPASGGDKADWPSGGSASYLVAPLEDGVVRRLWRLVAEIAERDLLLARLCAACLLLSLERMETRERVRAAATKALADLDATDDRTREDDRDGA